MEESYDQKEDQTMNAYENENEKKALEALKDMLTYNKQLSMWGIPLTSSETTTTTKRDVILMKFLRAANLKVQDSYYILINILSWRNDFGADSILEQDLGFNELEGVVSYMNGFDRQGNPVCYTDYGFLINNKQMHDNIFGSAENMQKFIKWRVQVFERGIKMLNFNPGGSNSIVMVYDFTHDFTEEMYLVEEKFGSILLDYYPRMVSYRIATNRNLPLSDIILDSVSNMLESISNRLGLTDQTESSMGIFFNANETNVFQTLYKYISPEYIPIQFGGLSQPGELNNHPVFEITVKGGEKVNIPVETRDIITWDVKLNRGGGQAIMGR